MSWVYRWWETPLQDITVHTQLGYLGEGGGELGYIQYAK